MIIDHFFNEKILILFFNYEMKDLNFSVYTHKKNDR
jgi:hypothetical protein